MEKTLAGRYRLEERLGAGGMAEVWVAHDLQLARNDNDATDDRTHDLDAYGTDDHEH